MFSVMSLRKSSSGFTFVELVMATAVMMVLASAALPLMRVYVRRAKENDLRRTLREVRTAIDMYKLNVDAQRIQADYGSDGYPASLDVLVNGVPIQGDMTGKRLRFLRRIPVDPITGTTDWGMRSYADPPTAKSWGGGTVFDIYTKSDGTALDGTKYKDW